MVGQTPFSIDICITRRDNEGTYYRLIHKKTGWAQLDEYYWNEAPKSKQIKQKVNHKKQIGQWERVRQQYERIKNIYLMRNDKNHPSFVCYVEAVNNVYNQFQ